MKAAQYAELVACRKTCGVCSPDLENPSRVAGGTLDSDRIGPYSQWQGSLGASLVVVAQDFADRDAFVRYRGWPGSHVPTNVALVDLLGQAGLAIHVPSRGQPDDPGVLHQRGLVLEAGRYAGVSPQTVLRFLWTQVPAPTDRSDRSCSRSYVGPRRIERGAPRVRAATRSEIGTAGIQEREVPTIRGNNTGPSCSPRLSGAAVPEP